MPAWWPLGAKLLAEGRLQRAPDFTGARLNSFASVVLRHGLPGLLLGLALLSVPALRDGLWLGLEAAAAKPLSYAAALAAVLVGASVYAGFSERSWQPRQLVWILYLGALSAWEEWVFRLALPQSFEMLGMGGWSAILLANAFFGALHYFSLRWKWTWCFAAFLGGLALSRHYAHEADFLALVAFHWIGTFINTPKAPGGGAQEEAPE